MLFLQLEPAQGEKRPARPAAGTTTRNLVHSGKKRTYRLHWPHKAPPGPRPLVVVLHGLGGNGFITEALTGFDELSNREGFVVAYPDGIDKMWRFWDGDQAFPRRGSNVDDIGFIGKLFDELVDSGLVDARRIYVTGISNGAYFSHRLAVDLNDRIAAIAPVAGTCVKLQIEQFQPKRPMPVICFHGTADQIVGIDGRDLLTRSAASLSAQQMAAWWAQQNKCGVEKIDELPDSVSDGTTVRKHVFPAPVRGTSPDPAQQAGPDVIYYEILGGGHTWPAGNFQPVKLLGPVCQDISATELIWEFFRTRSLPDKESLPDKK